MIPGRVWGQGTRVGGALSEEAEESDNFSFPQRLLIDRAQWNISFFVSIFLVLEAVAVGTDN